MALFLERFAKGKQLKPTPSDYTEFTDLPSSKEAKDAINWLSENNIAKGDTNAHFNPTKKVTREQMALFLHRLSDAIV
jgi:hypothetical protein